MNQMRNFSSLTNIFKIPLTTVHRIVNKPQTEGRVSSKLLFTLNVLMILFVCIAGQSIPRRRVLPDHPLSDRLPVQAAEDRVHHAHLPPEHKQQRQHLPGHS